MALHTTSLWVMMIAIIPIALAGPTSHAAFECNQTAALSAADAYVSAQTTGQLDPLQQLLSSNWTYQENNKATDAKTGVLSKALKIDHRRTNLDTTACATYTELIITNAASPYVIGTQIRHGTNMTIASVDSIVSTTNSWIFNANVTLQHLPNTRRRYVVDEAMGSVSIFCLWEHMMMAADSHEFRLEGGKLRYVHTMTVCGGQPCAL
ncbi:hypothetical protein LSUE1_G004686 [Lachnellula suecica]|uniref:DUF8021 domain-containing protein n=1 Tax=Lachnellula suecica TaxID=602035 RepID=A0A8T9C5K6_9HELO|nr:hypothetical protein LSUE1_G004686 [Lachnellula suecica]